MQVEFVPIERVIPYARNPRRNTRAVALVAAAIKEFGWQQPIVVDSEMVIVAGHTRLDAARVLELTEVPIFIASELSEQQVQAYRIADNRLAEESEWNPELLALELRDLLGYEYDLQLTALSATEIDKLLAVGEGNLLDPSLAEDSGGERPAKPDVYFSVGKYRIPMTDRENAALLAWVERYVAKNGGVEGLAAALLAIGGE